MIRWRNLLSKTFASYPFNDFPSLSMQAGAIFAHSPSGNAAVNSNVTGAGEKPGFIETNPEPQPPQIYCAVVSIFHLPFNRERWLMMSSVIVGQHWPSRWRKRVPSPCRSRGHRFVLALPSRQFYWCPDQRCLQARSKRNKLYFRSMRCCSPSDYRGAVRGFARM